MRCEIHVILEREEECVMVSGGRRGTGKRRKIEKNKAYTGQCIKRVRILLVFYVLDSISDEE